MTNSNNDICVEKGSKLTYIPMCQASHESYLVRNLCHIIVSCVEISPNKLSNRGHISSRSNFDSNIPRLRSSKFVMDVKLSGN